MAEFDVVRYEFETASQFCNPDFGNEIFSHYMLEVEKLDALLVVTPAKTIDDLIYKIEYSIGIMEDLCDSKDEQEILKKAIIELQSGNFDAAKKLLAAGIEDPEYDFAVAMAESAKLDLEQLTKG